MEARVPTIVLRDGSRLNGHSNMVERVHDSPGWRPGLTRALGWLLQGPGRSSKNDDEPALELRMFRISKLTDYGIVLLTHLARRHEREHLSARALASQAQLPVPTVSKLLKALARAGLVDAQRKRNGGYRLARSADEISLGDVILALDGPLLLTECCAGKSGVCQLEAQCPDRSNWIIINQAVKRALDGIHLSQMAAPLVDTPSPMILTIGQTRPRSATP